MPAAQATIVIMSHIVIPPYVGTVSLPSFRTSSRKRILSRNSLMSYSGPRHLLFSSTPPGPSKSKCSQPREFSRLLRGLPLKKTCSHNTSSLKKPYPSISTLLLLYIVGYLFKDKYPFSLEGLPSRGRDKISLLYRPAQVVATPGLVASGEPPAHRGSPPN